MLLACGYNIFDLMEKFAGYGFNKTHSASYALIAYQTAWLKTHYPAAFMASVLSSEMDRTEKVIHLLDECRAQKLQVVPPNINNSNYYFTSAQARQLIELVSLESNRLQLAKLSYRTITDRGNFTQLYDLFYSQSSKDELAAYVNAYAAN